jgi:P4 family phage/plasmid primase-like protien
MNDYKNFIDKIGMSEDQIVDYLLEETKIKILSFEDKYYIFNPETVLYDVFFGDKEIGKVISKLYKSNILDTLTHIYNTFKDDPYIDQEIKKKIIKLNNSSGSSTKIKNIKTIMLDRVKTLKEDIQSKQKPYLLPIKNNKVINMKKLRVEDRKEKHYFTFEIDAEIKEDCDLSLVKMFVDPIMKYHPERIELLQEIIGCFFTAEIVKYSFSFFGSKGNNGKSALINVVENLLGEYKGVLPRKVILNQKFKANAGEPELLSLRNRRLSVLTEIDHGESICETKFKELTGSDKIEARMNHSNKMIKFTNQSKLCFLLNKPFYVDTSDKATKNRIINLEFDALFSKNPKEGEYKEDASIPDRLIHTFEGRSQFLTWAVLGAKRFYDNNKSFSHQDIIQNDKDMYLKRVDPYHGFVLECCEFDSKYTNAIKNVELLQACRSYLTHKGSDAVDMDKLSIKHIKDRLHNRAVELVGEGVLRFVKIKGYDVVKGLHIKDIIENEDEEEDIDFIDDEEEEEKDNVKTQLEQFKEENAKLKGRIHELEAIIKKLTKAESVISSDSDDDDSDDDDSDDDDIESVASFSLNEIEGGDNEFDIAPHLSVKQILEVADSLEKKAKKPIVVDL